MPNFNSLADHLNYGAGADSHTLITDSGNASLLDVLELMAPSVREGKTQIVGIGLDQALVEQHGFADIFEDQSNDAGRALAAVIGSMLARITGQPNIRNFSKWPDSLFRPIFVLIDDYTTITSDPLVSSQVRQILIQGRALGVYVLGFTKPLENEVLKAKFSADFHSVWEDEPEDA
ncbi:hypothetical protein [Curtobacterium sp. PhB115]|uniref:hypothetical protein n=1 Tax=Curtobacterium sp. PhB115 TaxID=2485173 RepID=UPI000F4C3452|nr:hypothetical protein [Curtobacterium sp. PhB115]ROP74419.1 hypothetical protein EDF19_0503 [Curtobacterium sp. PhB115]